VKKLYPADCFQQTFQTDDLMVRADLLVDNDLYEIKSTTSVKPHHIPDLAFQKHVIEKTGKKINKCFIIHLNKEYIKQGEIEPEKLIRIEEVTEKVNLIDNIEENIKLIQKITTKPKPNISKGCNKPYICPLKKDCWSTLPENNVLTLTNWRLYWKLLEEGIEDISNIPNETKLNIKDNIIVNSIKENKPHIDKENIKEFLNKLTYPLYHFDFETFDTAVPLFNKSRPYQKIPFQYSLHIEQDNGKTEHKEFLSLGNDPRPDLLKQMKHDLQTKGDIVVYNKSFEISVMKKLIIDFPEEKEWLSEAIERVVDLADVFRPFYYYNKSQKGSYSIKKILPAVTGKDYSHLEISNGAEASIKYFYTYIEPKLKEDIKEDLLKYCKLDTEGMVWIMGELRKICK